MTRCLLRLFQLSGTGEYHVDRTYEDFEWLQQHLFSQEEVPGIQGVIVSAVNLINAQSTTHKSRTSGLEFVGCLVIACCFVLSVSNRLQLNWITSVFSKLSWSKDALCR